MGLTPQAREGDTPLDPDELEALIPQHVTTQAELNAFEASNIAQAIDWAGRLRKSTLAGLLSESFVRELHRRMLDDTWRWAGTFRKTEKNIGVAPEQIATRLIDLLRNVEAQLEFQSYTPAEITARFHHQLVWIHPFPNGNGRHARLMTDLLLMHRLGSPACEWGSGNLIDAGTLRSQYLFALRAADQHDFQPLIVFMQPASAKPAP